MSEYVIPERGEALRVGRAILDAHGQWEKENNCAGSQHPWQEPHVILLGQAAMLALSAPAPSQERGRTIEQSSRVRGRNHMAS